MSTDAEMKGVLLHLGVSKASCPPPSPRFCWPRKTGYAQASTRHNAIDERQTRHAERRMS